ncbi:MAG: YaaR family protein [Clostridiales bacterium]|jgi:uncharacterized protein YaaR (DUF327 family)|nr:YaaR family protein [Clostridiales bacterium]
MKIRNTQLKTKSLNIGSYSNEETSMEGVKDKKFADIMNDTKEQRAKEELTELLEEIRIQGEKLNKRLSLSEVIYFRKLVSRFLSRIVDGMLEFSKYDFFDHMGRHDVYAIIKTVDSKLDELVQEVAGSEKDTLKILTLTDDIRGLLVDLFY